LEQEYRRTPIHAQWIVGLVAMVAVVASPAEAQQQFDEVQIGTIEVADGVYMLTGSGGNLGLSVGEDGAFLVDDQYAPLTQKITAAIAAITDLPIKFVVNTHWHGDHTGGNENLGNAGVLIVAHENVRKRMSVEQFIEAFDSRTPPAPEAALPVITFTDEVTFHWNGDDLRVFHVDPAHTDGDAIIQFTDANVVHMGDTFFNGMYPFIDVGTGGSIGGMIAAADRVLGMLQPDTKIIPGHGELASVADLRAYRNMLASVRDRVRALIAEGKSRDEVIAAKPTASFDAAWGGGFMQPDIWTGIVYDGMVKNR
jgi:glyoxylase-like metal-dependent hydrolase (beta-lactamase superfamily II)